MNADAPASRTTLLLARGLVLAAVLLAVAAVVLGVLVVLRVSDDGPERAAAPSAAEQDRYGEVKRAAEATAVALVNIDYRDPQASLDAVAATSTGTFLDQYQASSGSLVRLVRSFRSVLEGEVVVSAVDDLDEDSATVLVATEGTVRNAQTGDGRKAVRNFRLYLTLVRQDDAWLTNDLEFAG